MTHYKPAPEQALRSKDTVIFGRDDHDFYPEEYWPVHRICEAEEWQGRVWDPACGFGTIPQVFSLARIPTVATDLIDRGYGTGGQNFLAFSRQRVKRVDNIVCNPPFSLLIEFLKQAKLFTTDKVAFLVPLKWLASKKRFYLFRDVWRPARIYVLSDRLSMPPGAFIDPETRLFNCDDPNPKKDGTLRWRKGDKPSGGAVDFCWIVWEHGNTAPTQTHWLSRDGVLK